MGAITPFSPKAARFIKRHPRDDAWINILEGSIRSGKTWALIPKILALCRYDVGGRRLITGVSKQTVYNNVLMDLFAIVGTANYSFNRQTGQLRLFGADWLVMGAKDEGSEKYIRGMTVGVAVCDEVTLMPETFFKMLLGRMSPEGARLYGTTNPDNPFHYLKRDILDNQSMRDRGEVWSEHFGLDDNLSLSEAVKERYRKSFTGFFYLRYIEGKWVVAEGAVYGSCWSDDLLYDISPASLRIRGGYVDRFIPLDYGTANATCWYDVIDDGELYWIDDEYYWDSRVTLQQKTDAQYIDDLLAWKRERDADSAMVVCDPSAASLKAEMDTRGIWYCDGDNDVLPGIARLSSLMAQKKLRINRKCKRLIQQLQAYSWDDKACKRGEERPIKHEDHGPDAIRVWAFAKVPQWRLAA